jgi:hypothetical protein
MGSNPLGATKLAGTFVGRGRNTWLPVVETQYGFLIQIKRNYCCMQGKRTKNIPNIPPAKIDKSTKDKQVCIMFGEV